MFTYYLPKCSVIVVGFSTIVLSFRRLPTRLEKGLISTGHITIRGIILLHVPSMRVIRHNNSTTPYATLYVIQKE